MYAVHHKCEFVKIFLSWGADPTPYLAGIERFANWQVKEWVNKAMQLRIWEESSRQGSREAFHLSKHNCDTINTAPFEVVGQASSVYAVLRGFKGSAFLKTKSCCVIAMGGPSGNGKTHFAHTLGESLSSDGEQRFIHIRCEVFTDPEEIHGVSGPFVDNQRPTELCKFLMDVEGKHAVVLLDEFDKCTLECRESFLSIFDNGLYVNKQGNRVSATSGIDCSKVCWLLTMNYLDRDIENYFQELKKNRETRCWVDPIQRANPENGPTLLKKIMARASHKMYTDAMRSSVLTEPIISRVSLWVPFFKVDSRLEKCALVYSRLEQLKKDALEAFGLGSDYIEQNTNEICDGILRVYPEMGMRALVKRSEQVYSEYLDGLFADFRTNSVLDKIRISWNFEEETFKRETIYDFAPLPDDDEEKKSAAD